MLEPKLMDYYEIVRELEWTDERGVTGFGWGEPKSVVTVMGPSTKYTLWELRRILQFSRERSERYDSMFNSRRGCNMTVIDKMDEHNGSAWMVKRSTWTAGRWVWDDLDVALNSFTRRDP